MAQTGVESGPGAPSRTLGILGDRHRHRRAQPTLRSGLSDRISAGPETSLLPCLFWPLSHHPLR